jgi:hypothetical protein
MRRGAEWSEKMGPLEQNSKCRKKKQPAVPTMMHFGDKQARRSYAALSLTGELG